MERVLRLLLAVVVSLSLAACGAERPAIGEEPAGLLAPEAAAASAQAAAAARNVPNGPKLTVMTRNLYLGADIATLTTAETGPEVVAAASQLWVDVHLTDFPARARVLADEVFWARPEVLGLQEVTLYRSGDPARLLRGGLLPARPSPTDPELDFLAVLQKELRRRGLQYEVAAQVTTMDVELCIVDALRGGEPRDLRYTDRDVLLVRKDVHWRNPTLPASQPIAAFVPAPLPPGTGTGTAASTRSPCTPATRRTPSSPATAYFEVPEVSGNLVYSWRGWTAVEVAAGQPLGAGLRDPRGGPASTPSASWVFPAWFFQALQDAAARRHPRRVARAWRRCPTIVLGDFNVYKQPSGDLDRSYDLLTGGDFPLDPRSSGLAAAGRLDRAPARRPGIHLGLRRRCSRAEELDHDPRPRARHGGPAPDLDLPRRDTTGRPAGSTRPTTPGSSPTFSVR